MVGAGGNDTITLDQTNGLLPGAALFGDAGNDVLTGGSGDDFADGGTGSDTVALGAGNDTFQWNPGDGSDSVDAGAGKDGLVFNGSDLAEKFDISDSGIGAPFHNVHLTRDVGNVALDLNGIEGIDLNAMGGADAITVNDQSVTDIFSISVDLSSPAGVPDGQADTVTLNGTSLDDVGEIDSFSSQISANVSAFPVVNIVGADGPLDMLKVNALAGDDVIDASAFEANAMSLTLNGGEGEDQIVGSEGDDSIIGGPGNDKVFMGGGDDSFVWNGGDGSDTVDGQQGTDTLIFSGSNADEDIDLSADGSHVKVTDSVGAVAIDANGFEQTSVAPLAGTDHVVVNDLTGTALRIVKVKLNADSQPDDVTVSGTDAPDAIVVDGDFTNGVTVTGGHTQVNVIGALTTTDSLTVSGKGGADTLNASTLLANALRLNLDGDAGNDTLTASQGDGSIDGGAGTDTINVPGGFAGTTTIVPSTGDDAVNAGTDGGGVARVAFGATQRIGALSIGAGGLATVTPGGKVLTVTSLKTSGAGKLNLNNNALIIDYAALAQSPIADVQSMLTTGFHNGAWDGKGIMSSLANASTFALGFAEASDVATGGLFAGQSVDNSAVVVKFTLYGDATLDGKVDFNDLVKLAQNFNTAIPQGSSAWNHGDFTYDSTDDFNDLVKLAQNYNTMLPASSSAAPTPNRRPSVPVHSFSTRRVTRNSLLS